jgi:energy-coupling factor transport system ATP-binding protein
LPPIIHVENLGYAYPSLNPEQEPNWVLQDMNLSVEEGEFVSLMGPTGVGKTTFCLALNGIVPQLTGGTIRGRVTVDGLITVAHPVAELAQRVGVVFQDPETQLFNSTVEAEVAFGLENLGVPSQEIRERTAWALSLVGMHAKGDADPAGLSGGEKQRVAIAALLAMTPKILVLDEPTANLDPRGKAEVFSVVEGMRRSHRAAVIFASHESEYVAEFSDRVVVMQHGRVALEGGPEQVFSQVGALREIGLHVPQVCELADCLNRNYGRSFSFYRLEQAVRALQKSPISGVS